MKDFVKFVFASCLGVTLAGVALIFIGSSAVAGLEQVVKVKLPLNQIPF
jgi:hypothetical protein